MTASSSAGYQTDDLLAYELVFTITNRDSAPSPAASLRVFFDPCTQVWSAYGECGRTRQYTNEVRFETDGLAAQAACQGSVWIIAAGPGPGTTPYAFRYELSPDSSAEDHMGQVLVDVQCWYPLVGFGWPLYTHPTENAGYVEFTVTRSYANLCGWPTVDYETVEGTARAGVDFVPTRGTLCFTNGQSSTTFRVTIIPTSQISDAKSFTVLLKNPTGNLALGPASNLAVNIQDVDRPAKGWIAPVSVLDTNLVAGGGAANNSHSPLVTADGRFVYFTSRAVGLVPGITNSSAERIYRRDLQRNSTELVVRPVDETVYGYPIEGLSISADGAWLAFSMMATNVSPFATNYDYTAFLRDVSNQVTHLVSVNTNNTASPGSVSQLSHDGRYVVFASSATDLTTNKFNQVGDLFLRDRLTGTTRLITADPSGESPSSRTNGFAYAFAFTGNRYVFFNSDISDLVPGDNNETYDVFVYDLVTGRVRCASENVDETVSPFGPSLGYGASADGRFVAFTSKAWDLVWEDVNDKMDVFVRDLWNDSTVLASVSIFGTAGNELSAGPQMSRDGRYVAFHSKATDLVPEGVTGYTTDVYLRDLVTGSTRLVMPGASYPWISPSGRFVVAQSEAWLTLGANDGSNAGYVADLSDGSFEMLTRSPTGDNVAGYFLGVAFDESSPSIAYYTDGPLVANDSGVVEEAGLLASDVYIWRLGPAPGGIDLAVKGSPTTNLFLQATNISWTVTVTNQGAHQATGIKVGTFSYRYPVVAAEGSQGSADPGSPASYNLDSLSPGRAATVTFTASAGSSWSLWPPDVRAWASASEPELTPHNNSCGIPITCSASDADADGDGMSNSWELAHGLQPTSGADALIDSDADGVPNLFEFVAGTNPHDSQSQFRVNDVRVTTTNVLVRVPSVAGRKYGLERNTHLPYLPWEPVTNGVHGSGGDIELADPADPGSRNGAVYRATVGP